MDSAVVRDRREAGQVLASRLARYWGRDDVVVLALPRGGVPVAYEVAKALQAPLDVFVVRKLGVPNFPELAAGAIAGGGVVITNDDVLRAHHVQPEALEAITSAELRELARREKAYRGDRPPIDIAGKTVVVVDDGLATGATMYAALEGIRAQSPARVIVAVPVAPQHTCEELRRLADEVVCATTPRRFTAVGAAYWNFDQTSDGEVRKLLATSARMQDGTQPEDAVLVIQRHAVPAPSGVPSDKELFDLVGDAAIVLIGEASHGTHEFYNARAHMTRRLIEEKGFQAVAVEADWPDAYRANRYVRGIGKDANADAALASFERFPQWMWRNTVVADFIEWLRTYNTAHHSSVGFYGLDLYSLRRSIDEVIKYLDARDPAAARRARDRYSCFEHFADDQHYGYATAFGAGESCEDEVIQQLIDLQRLDLDRVRRGGMAETDERFYAQQNARLVKSAEEYYRSMFIGRITSWNLRDRHMAATLRELANHLKNHSGAAKIVVWAHNSHVGDARATELGDAGEVTLGQLARETFPSQCCSIGFTTFTGTVTAGDDWGQPAKTMRVRPALLDSVEALLHSADRGDYLLRPAMADKATAMPQKPLLQRAIGVVYRPDTERQSHYFLARLADQFDAVIHLDTTCALQPLHTIPEQSADEPQTYPHTV